MFIMSHWQNLLHSVYNFIVAFLLTLPLELYVLCIAFQVVFEGMWGSSRANGFMALDDITVFRGDCTSKYQEKFSWEATTNRVEVVEYTTLSRQYQQQNLQTQMWQQKFHQRV